MVGESPLSEELPPLPFVLGLQLNMANGYCARSLLEVYIMSEAVRNSREVRGSRPKREQGAEMSQLIGDTRTWMNI